MEQIVTFLDKVTLTATACMTDLGVPIMLSICFSMIKGERDVTAFSSID